MSNTFKISKVRLAEIIKEEYASIREELDNPLGRPQLAEEETTSEPTAVAADTTPAEPTKPGLETIKDLIRKEMESL